MGYRIGIDVGGTFTDFVVADEKGKLYTAKVPSTPHNQALGVISGLEKIAQKEGVPLGELLTRTDYMAHGTTVATNTMVEYTGAVTGLITTEGFRDLLEFRRGYKESIFDPRLPPPFPIVPRRRRFGVKERIDLEGKVLVPLEEEGVLEALRRFKEAGVESVAVCFLFSFLNSSHERRVAELIELELPGVNVSLSHEVLPEIREFERVSTTVVNAYVGPKLGRYLRSLEDHLARNGYRYGLLVMQSNGGVMDVEYLSRKPVHSLLSGPAGGVIGGAHLGALAGYENFITVDMGGTSYDVCLVKGLQPERTTASWFSRYRLAVPMIDLHTVGAGGGSIGWVDAGGALRVGPQSSGADPGPVCYGKGGEEPTVTDANLVLGYLNPENFLGGEMKLDVDQAVRAIEEKIGHPLQMDLYQAAYGIFKIVNHNMTNAIRVVSVHRGHDPREFSLVAFGGGGPVHAGIQARELGIRRVIVPKAASAFSALGLLSADLVISKTRSYVAGSQTADLGRINDLFASMTAEVKKELTGQDLHSGEILFRRFIDFHYQGQTHEITTPLLLGQGSGGAEELGSGGVGGQGSWSEFSPAQNDPSLEGEGEAITEEDLRRCIARYHELHERLHTFSNPDQPVELMVLRLEGVGLTWKPQLPPLELAGEDPSGALKGQRKVYFEELGGFQETLIYEGNRVQCGNFLEGPCVIEEPTTTIVVYPGQRATLSRLGNYEIDTGSNL